MTDELGQQSTTGGERLDVLLEAAKPDLYRLNAFRITELPVDASTRDISRRQQMVEMAREAGLPIPPGPGRALPMDDASTPEVLAQAMQRLRDPERRLVDEFFWFWPHQLGQSGNDEALAALTRGDTDAASRIWAQQERTHSEANVSMHNLALLAHATALDLEQADSQARPTPAAAKQRALWWQRAFERWRILLDHEGFWSRLDTRIRDLDDQRLTTGTARRLRATLPLALLSISAQLAVQAAESGATAEAERHLRIMQESGFERSAIDDALQRTIQPVRQRVRALCQNAEAEANADPEHADAVVRRLLDQTKALLNVLDCLLPAEHPTRQTMHDEVALTALHCQITYGNKTENWKVSLDLLQCTLPVAVGKAVCERLEENIRIVQGNQQSTTCWFCGQSPPEEEAAIEVKMHGNVQRTPFTIGSSTMTRLQWQQTTIRVPRCASCKAAHSRADIALVVGAALGILVGLGGLVTAAAGAPADGLRYGAIILILSTGAGVCIGLGISRALLPPGIKTEDTKLKFPSIVALQKEGWEVGEKPPGAN